MLHAAVLSPIALQRHASLPRCGGEGDPGDANGLQDNLLARGRAWLSVIRGNVVFRRLAVACDD
jgi:hypothetical protein